MNGARDPFEDRVYADHQDLLRDPLGHALARNFDLGIHDKFTLDEISRRVEKHLGKMAFGDALPFRTTRCRQGGLALGNCMASGELVCVDPSVLTRHVLVGSSTGGGKSVFLTFILLQMFRHTCGILTTDLHKADLRHLSPLAARMGVDFITLRGSDLVFNPLQTDGANPHEHLTSLCSVLRRTLNLPDRAAGILAWACAELYENMGVFRGQVRDFPHLFEVYELIRSTASLNAVARESVLGRLGTFLSNLTPAVGAYRQAWPVRALLGQRLNLELHGSSEVVKGFYMDLLFRRAFDSAVRDGTNGAGQSMLKQLIVLDDAQHFIASENSTDGLRPVDEMLSLARGAGIGAVICLQSIAGLRTTLLSNLSTRVTGCLRTHADLCTAASDGGFSQEQVAWCRLKQRVGEFVVTMGDGDWRLPIAIRVPFANVPRVVTDEMVVESQAPLRAIPVRFDERFRHWRPMESVVVRQSGQARAAHTSAPTATTNPAHSAASPATAAATRATHEPEIIHHGGPLDDGELRLLCAVVDHPGLPSSRYPALAKLKSDRTIKARAFLVEHGYITEHSFATSVKGRTAITLQPSEIGKQTVARARAFVNVNSKRSNT